MRNAKLHITTIYTEHISNEQIIIAVQHRIKCHIVTLTFAPKHSVFWTARDVFRYKSMRT